MIRALYCGTSRPSWLADAGHAAGALSLRSVPSLEALLAFEGRVDVVLMDVVDGVGLETLRRHGGPLAEAALVLVAAEAQLATAFAHAARVGAHELVRLEATSLELGWALHKAHLAAVDARRAATAAPPCPRRAALEHALRRNLSSGQVPFTLHFQPRVELRTGQFVGAEALLRYAPSDLGPVQPSELVATLESLGRIEAVGAWVLREACKVSAAWERAGHPLVVGVNVSAHQLAAGCFQRVVEDALAASGASPELLELELTEGVLIADTTGARGLLAALRARGVRVAVDDFGTGYASLRYVKHLPMDTIKIDREFVRGLPHDAYNVAITTAIVSLAHRLGIEVVAEGVEDAAEETFLRELGCDYVQGFLRARPMPAEDLRAWLTHRPAAVSQLNLLCRDGVERASGE